MSFRQDKCESSAEKNLPDTPPCVWRLGVLLALIATTLAAQTNVADWNTVKALTTGTQVRITIGSRTVRGEIDQATDGALVVTSGKGQEMFEGQHVSVVRRRD